MTRRKEYGNHPEDEYVGWFETFAEQFKRVLREDGSLVIDLGGAWMLGSPTRSLYQYKLLIALVEKFEFHLAEDLETNLQELNYSPLFYEPDNMLDFPNTNSSDDYHGFCKSNELRRHPARFPRAVRAALVSAWEW